MKDLFSENDRRKLFLEALSNGPETPMSTYAFDAVSKAYDASPIWTQWLGAALHNLETHSEYNIDQLIAENQSLGEQNSDEPYQNAGYGGWSVKYAASFLGTQPDLHHGYVLDGSGVGYSMVFPKDPRAWTIPDRTSTSFMDYHLWGNLDHIFRISLGVWFDEPQDHAVHQERFEAAVSSLLSEAFPDDIGDQIRREFKKAQPFTLRFKTLEATFTSEHFSYPRETPSQHYNLQLKHLDQRSKSLQKMEALAGKNKLRPTRDGGWGYQTACLRSSLVTLGF